jgi:hypothetical protein
VIGPIPSVEMALDKLEQMPDIAGAILLSLDPGPGEQPDAARPLCG